ncbi:acyl-CoA dehydrogenase C-terminal domain-containing protein, partial [Acinetobacter baumannii]|uniref:acyl-CoA dehydrogenase C-terminal domain-containing protein n=1 Tax=Acinetobacter baumannii TaxID=470 RepID=UPI000570DACC
SSLENNYYDIISMSYLFLSCTEKAKLTTAKFFYQKLLHRTQSHAASIESGAESVMELDQDAFAF